MTTVAIKSSNTKNANNVIKDFLFNVLVISLYWVIFIVLPFFCVQLLMKGIYRVDWAGYVIFYVLFFAPLFFFIPYNFAKIESHVSKSIFVLAGVIIPYLIIYSYFYYALTHMGAPRF